MAGKPDIDWDAIECSYREGKLTLRQIAAEHNVTHGAINKRANKYEWTRDLSAKIKAKAEEMVSKALVSSSVSKATEMDIIKSAAELQAGALLQESEEVKRLSGIAEGFEEELKLLEDDLEKRTKILKSLTEVREKIINLRRRNLGINDNANGDANKTPVKEVRYTVIDSTCTLVE